jgi:hypothetical protein
MKRHVVADRERNMSSMTTLRWASALGTVLLALLAAGLVASSPRPAQAPLHPSVRLLPDDSTVQSYSYVS